MATLLRFIFFLLLMPTTQIFGQNLPIYKPKDEKTKPLVNISNSYKSNHSMAFTFHYTENFVKWFGSPFIDVINRDGHSNNKSYLPEYESYMNKGTLIMSGGDMRKRYEERCHIGVIDGSKDMQISTYVQFIDLNVGYEVEAEKRLDNYNWQTHVRRRWGIDNATNKLYIDTSKIGFGIFFYEDNILAENGLRFGITEDGYAFVNRVIDKYSAPIVSKNITIPSSLNGKIKLKIEKKGNVIYYYIIGMSTPVFTISINEGTYDFSGSGSPMFGLFIDGNQKVSFERFEVSGFRSN